MKNNDNSKIYTTITLLMIFIPWTILPLRGFDWALASPVAEIMIGSYAVWMILSGVFTVFVYTKRGIQNNLMKICLVINSIYAAFGIVALGMMFLGK